ncbi:MAG: helix-turn-helix domain-containing protein [Micromonosporaceae bacterium]|nr:helix-turn-helix domain-containing protein [Micromonosporaceae bacterium]
MAHRVAVLALDGVAAFDLGTATQIFGAARDATEKRLYAVHVCTADGGPVRASGGFTVMPEFGPSILDDVDTVVIPGVHGEFFVDGVPGFRDVEVAALRRIPATTRIVSICTAAFAVALLGRLDGRPATTHWMYVDQFRRLYPTVRLNPDVLFVDDGDVLTSAGVGAGVDLCLHVVRRDFGSEVANRAARRSVMPPWRDGGQAQYIVRHVPDPAGSSTAPAREYALANLDAPLDLATLARQCRMSVRTFTRRFRDETGLSPAAWVTRQRVEHARLLLETTDLSVDQIARRAGFGTAVSLRAHLRAAVGVSPLTYRRTFRPTAA